MMQMLHCHTAVSYLFLMRIDKNTLFIYYKTGTNKQNKSLYCVYSTHNPNLGQIWINPDVGLK